MQTIPSCYNKGGKTHFKCRWFLPQIEAFSLKDCLIFGFSMRLDTNKKKKKKKKKKMKKKKKKMKRRKEERGYLKNEKG